MSCSHVLDLTADDQKISRQKVQAIIGRYEKDPDSVGLST